ncbi:hypothetical protein EDD11_005309 [Mortierella claussenii]|nr:hypothetical protein EDD11_005309 [Mortierella claussenii]
MSMVNQSAPYGSASCSCEECSRYKMPLQTEQSSATVTSLLQQQPNTAMMGGDCDRDSGATSSTSPPTTYLVRRASVANTASSPRMQPAGFGSASAQMAPHQRRASLEFHNRERSFQQHSTACDCKGSGQ